MDKPRRIGRLLRPTLLPAVGILIVLATALVLVFQITLRPWANADTSWNTHLNQRLPPDDYTRTRITGLGPGLGGPAGWEPLPVPTTTASQSQLDYVGYGCASCHGLRGQGTAAAPPIAGSSLRRATTLTRQGPGGMPAYAEAHLRAASLDGIAEYVLGLPEVPEPTPPAAALAPTPFPTTTPTPLPTSTPAPTATPTATPLPPGAPTPTPAPTATPAPSPTPAPTPDPVRLEKAARLFIDVGCDLCHGEDAGGTQDGPSLHGLELTAREIADFVRKPERPPDSKYAKEMKPYGLDKLLDEELDELIYFLLNLPE